MEFYYGNRYDIVYSVGFILSSVNILFVKIPSTYVAVVIDTEILLLMLWLLLSKILFYLVQHIKFKITHVFCLKNTYHIFWLQYTYEFLVAAIYCIYKWICWPNQKIKLLFTWNKKINKVNNEKRSISKHYSEFTEFFLSTFYCGWHLVTLGFVWSASACCAAVSINTNHFLLTRHFDNMWARSWWSRGLMILFVFWPLTQAYCSMCTQVLPQEQYEHGDLGPRRVTRGPH